METRQACDSIRFDEDIKLTSMLSDQEFILEAGSEGIVDLRGNVRITTGELRGKILPRGMFDFEMKGVNNENLAKLILRKLKRELPDFDDYLEGYELKDNEIEDEIWEVLSDYL